ncbi:MAG: HEAT repeat domain-containing protein [Phycisphaeraceae bacterium]
MSKPAQSRTCLLAALLLSLSGCSSDPDSLGPNAQKLPSNAPKAVQGLVNPYDPDARRNAASAVADRGLVREAGYTTLLRDLTDDDDPTVRAAAIRALMTQPDPADAPIFIKAIADPIMVVRWEAASALARIHDPQSINALISTMQDDEAAEVRAAAASALGQYRDSSVVDVLVAALDDPDFIVVRSVRDSLTTLTGQTLGTDPAPWARWVQEHRSSLFANARPYRFSPYTPPPRFFEHLTPWEDRDTTPKPPAGATTN